MKITAIQVKVFNVNIINIADEASLKQSAEALVNEITIRDIMNPNLDSTHSFKPKSKNSESSNIDKSNKTSSKRNSKGSGSFICS